jgi:hypothetical protein
VKPVGASSECRRADLDVVWMDECRQTQYCPVDRDVSGYAKLRCWLRKGPVEAVCRATSGRSSEGGAEYWYQG